MTEDRRCRCPTDVVVREVARRRARARSRRSDEVAADEMILDIGPKTRARRSPRSLKKAGTIVWNGPVGVFEMEPFAKGTEALARGDRRARRRSRSPAAATRVAAIHKFGIDDRIGYISTAGGAFLEFLEGKTLPGGGGARSPRGWLSSSASTRPGRGCTKSPRRCVARARRGDRRGPVHALRAPHLGEPA